MNLVFDGFNSVVLVAMTSKANPAPNVTTIISNGVLPPIVHATRYASLQFALSSSGAQIPFVGLSAAFYLGFILVPLAGVSGGLGIALGAAGKNK